MEQNTYTHKSKRSLSINSQFNTNNKKLSCEEIINKMENEQDAIVVRLLREINLLKNENNKLRNQLLHHNNNNSNKKNSDDEVIIDDDEIVIDDDKHLPITPRRSFNNSSLFNTPIPSRRPSNVNSNTIFPIETNNNNNSTSFLKPKRFSFSYGNNNTTNNSNKLNNIDNLSINQNRKRRTSSIHSLENNPHYKNHEKKVNEIIPMR